MCFMLAEYLMLIVTLQLCILVYHFPVHLSLVLTTYAELDISYFFGVLDHTCVEEVLNSVCIVSQDLIDLLLS